MSFFRDLDILKILQTGLLGLCFLLSLLTACLIRIEQKITNPRQNILKLLFGFMISNIILILLVIYSQSRNETLKPSVQLGDNAIEINEIPNLSTTVIDTKKYFINSEFGFAFKRPNKRDWTDIQKVVGIEGEYKLNGLEIPKTMIKWDSILRTDSFSRVLLNANSYYFYNPRSVTKFEITDSTSDYLIDNLLRIEYHGILKIGDVSGFDTATKEGQAKIQRHLDSLRRYLLSMSNFETKEAFVVSIYPKDSLPSYMKNLKLPAFYSLTTKNSDFYADKLIASDNQILSGDEITIYNVKLNGKLSKIQVRKWLLFAENDKCFFIINLQYSPQTSGSMSLWDDLRGTLNSFIFLDN
jgi:hypothetical protein